MGQVIIEHMLTDYVHVCGIGNTSRSCKSLGNWDVPDVRRCSSTIYHNLFERICNVSCTV